jgi:hypothetical protein
MSILRQSLFGVLASLTSVCAAADVAYAAQAFGSRTVVVPSVRAELEPDAEPTSNWPAFQKQLEELAARPATEDRAVIDEVRAMGRAAPPPFLMEMGKRLARTDPSEGAYWYRLGWVQSLYTEGRCKDRSARGGVTIAYMIVARDQAAVQAVDAPELRLPALERVLQEGGQAEGSRASAWWLCSHGMQAMRAGMSGATELSLSDWFASEDDAQRTAAEAKLADGLKQLMARDRAALETPQP